VTLTLLEKTLIDNARTHQEVLANYYPKYQARKSVGDDHTEYLKHSGALTDLVSLTLLPILCHLHIMIVG